MGRLAKMGATCCIRHRGGDTRRHRIVVETVCVGDHSEQNSHHRRYSSKKYRKMVH
jgi:hypothetical protein